MDKQFYTPAEAVKKIEEIHGRTITITRLAQLRRSGKIGSMQLGYNTTVYTLENIEQADLTLEKVGRKPKTRSKNP